VSGSPLDNVLFANGGELGREMSALDRAQTPEGPPASWPSGLRNAVRNVLTSRFSMWAAYGPELTTFYNDAYRRDTVQATCPWALGRPAREVWAEIWHGIGPRIQSVLDTGIAAWDEDLQLFLERSGYPEETYHTFSYSPLDAEDGRPDGVLAWSQRPPSGSSASAGWRRCATSPRQWPPPAVRPTCWPPSLSRVRRTGRQPDRLGAAQRRQL
jgi:hypothetical protein